MTVDFSPANYRAASSDLAISISPLGLVELADEEFEIHGPRLNRYSLNWAMYLGSHYSYRRATGEPQVVINLYRALTDYVINFTFGKGVQFRSPKATEAIVPDLLKRIWETDNDKATLLWEIGQQGSVSGDVFLKVAYEEARQDSAGNLHPGRVRILPLNAAYCFPEFHPHDRDRLIRFKLKYRFWGCVDTKTEALTRSGWKTYDQITDGEEILALDPETDTMSWQPAKVNVYDYSGHMVRWNNHIDAMSTPNHRWLVEQERGRGETLRHERKIGRTEFALDGDPAVKDLRKGSRIIVAGGDPTKVFADHKSLPDEVVETLAWFICEGNYHTNQTGFLSGRVSQSATRYPEKLERIRALAKWWADNGFTFSEGKQKADGVVEFYLGKGVVENIAVHSPNKKITPEFLTSLTREQAQLFYDTLLDADGCRTHGEKATTRWTQLDADRKAAFQMLAAMLGIRSAITSDDEKVQVYSKRHILACHTEESAERVYLEDGKIWCPTVEGGIWFARRNGSTYWTGNTSPEGTRQVYTYTEILTDDTIEEYINDELLDSRPNPLGEIPVVHIPNFRVSGSPWGLADGHDITNINRQYNEVATAVSDIVNYHAEPTTVIIGAKASQLEKGANKIWGGLPDKAKVFNLEGGAQGLNGALELMNQLKQRMHELTGVPESALGQMQPISNTSGVALSIMFQPLMNKWQQKVALYSRGLERVNELALKQLFLKEPGTEAWTVNDAVPLREDQLAVLDLSDPVSYRSMAYFPQPLPLDKLVVLNEISMKVSMGLESKEGALRALGEEFPDEKLAEIRAELVEDAKSDGAIEMLKSMIASATSQITGMTPDGQPMDPAVGGGSPSDGGGPVAAAGEMAGSLIEPSPFAQAGMEGVAKMAQEMLVRSFGTKLAQSQVAHANHGSEG